MTKKALPAAVAALGLFLSAVAAIALCLAPTAALAQSSPGFVNGQPPPTAAQWNSYFAKKIDYNQGPSNAIPYWTVGGALASAVASGDCTAIASHFTCPTLSGVAPGNLFPLNAGTGLTISGISLNASNPVPSNLTLTNPASPATFTLLGGKTFTVDNTLTLSGTDASTLNVGGGGTLGSNAFTSTAFLPLTGGTLSGTLTGADAGAWGATGLNGVAIGVSTPEPSHFTTISATGQITSTLASGTAPFAVASTTNVANLNASSLSGATFASPGPIGSGSPGTGSFTTLAASSTVSGAGFSTYLASPPAIGGSSPAAGAFTTLSASSTVSGAGFSTYLASPPAIGGSAAASGKFTSLSSSSTLTTTQVTETAHQVCSSCTGAETIDLTAGTYFYGTTTGATTWSVSNVASSGSVSSFTLELTNGGSQTQTWMSGTKWPGGATPTLTTAGVDLLVCSTRDAATTWRCVASELNSH